MYQLNNKTCLFWYAERNWGFVLESANISLPLLSWCEVSPFSRLISGGGGAERVGACFLLSGMITVPLPQLLWFWRTKLGIQGTWSTILSPFPSHFDQSLRLILESITEDWAFIWTDNFLHTINWLIDTHTHTHTQKPQKQLSLVAWYYRSFPHSFKSMLLKYNLHAMYPF